MPSSTKQTVPARTKCLSRSQGVLGLTALATLLCSSPVFAASNPFTVYFNALYGSTNTPPSPSTATAVFTVNSLYDSLTQTTTSDVQVVLKNTTAPPTQSTLVGIAFVTPDYLTFNSYNDGGTVFTKLYQYPNADINGGPFQGIAYDLCVRSEGSGGQQSCNGGQANSGLNTGDPAAAPITFKFTSSGNKSEQAIADDFIKLYSLQPPNSTPTYNIAARFQQISGCGSRCPGSDKIGGAITDNPPPPPPAPGDEVPAPLPLMGAAAAFGYSRKLRTRLKQPEAKLG